MQGACSYRVDIRYPLVERLDCHCRFGVDDVSAALGLVDIERLGDFELSGNELGMLALGYARGDCDEVFHKGWPAVLNLNSWLRSGRGIKRASSESLSMPKACRCLMTSV